MIKANIAQFKSHLSEYLHKVQAGESLAICKRNVPLAKVMPYPKATANCTMVGCGRQTVCINTDLTEPVLDEEDWEMFGGDET